MRPEAGAKMTKRDTTDGKYLALVLDALSVCRDYKPKFGKGAGDGLRL
jgi:hypothetical protein